MASEIIMRDFSKAQMKTQLEGEIQISYNSDGRLVIRYVHTNHKDELIVFDDEDTKEILAFIKKLLDGLNRYVWV